MTDVNNIAKIKKDRLRFTKNKLSSWLVYLAIVFDCIFFVNIYSSDVGTYYYSWLIGISVIYNLVFLLISFLSSEGVKNYKMSYGFVLIVLGAIQVARIFIIPLNALNTTDPTLTTGDVEQYISEGSAVPTVMDSAQFILCAVVLVASAALCVAAGIIAIIKTTTLNNYQAELEKNARGSKT